jgi:hypothetical protein
VRTVILPSSITNVIQPMQNNHVPFAGRVGPESSQIPLYSNQGVVINQNYQMNSNFKKQPKFANQQGQTIQKLIIPTSPNKKPLGPIELIV